MADLPSDSLGVERLTLRAANEHKQELVFQCRLCGRCQTTDLLKFVHRYGPEATIGDLRKRARCERCNVQKAQAFLRSQSAGRRAGWMPYPPRDIRR
jgi:hypothetical protein